MSTVSEQGYGQHMRQPYINGHRDRRRPKHVYAFSSAVNIGLEHITSCPSALWVADIYVWIPKHLVILSAPSSNEYS
jgi:hypothetical protein